MNEPQTILILEDCPQREYRMRDAMVDRFPFYRVEVAKTAVDFATLLAEISPGGLALVSMDHDLEPAEGAGDPGDGREAAAALAARGPECPVVIHSTNGPAAEEMRGTLTDAGWAVCRVLPTDGHRWVRTLWFRVVRSLLVHGRTPAGFAEPAEAA